MDTFVKKPSNSCLVAIKILSIIALVFAVSSVYFNFFHPIWGIYSNVFIDEFGALLTVTSIVLFVIYIFGFHSQKRATVLVPITFGFIALEAFYYLLQDLSYGADFFYILWDLAIVVGFGFALYGALRGNSNKLFIIIPASVALFFELCYVIKYLSWGLWWIDLVVLFSLTITGVTFYVAILLFGIKCTIPALINNNNIQQDAYLANSKQELEIINQNFKLGLISPEEYRARRMDIINRL